MSDGIYYNQEVTAQMLNDIALDLGATGFNGFGEEKFGADALNGITAALVGKGVLMSDNMCKPVLTGEKLYIQPGTIVFENGAKKTIAEALEVELINGTYVYAQNNQTAGTCEIIVSQTQPDSGDYVMLARVDADGKVIDMRDFARAKVSLNSANVIHNFSLTITKSYSHMESFEYDYEYKMPHADFKYLLLLDDDDPSELAVPQIVDISQEGTWYIELNYTNQISRKLYIKRVGDTLHFGSYRKSGSHTYQFALV